MTGTGENGDYETTAKAGLRVWIRGSRSSTSGYKRHSLIKPLTRQSGTFRIDLKWMPAAVGFRVHLVVGGDGCVDYSACAGAGSSSTVLLTGQCRRQIIRKGPLPECRKPLTNRPNASREHACFFVWLEFSASPLGAGRVLECSVARMCCRSLILCQSFGTVCPK